MLVVVVAVLDVVATHYFDFAQVCIVFPLRHVSEPITGEKRENDGR